MLTDTIHLSWVSTRHFFQSRRRKTPPQILKSGWAEHKRLPIKNKDTIITQLGTSNPSIQEISKIKRVVLTKVYLDEISNHLISTSFEFINLSVTLTPSLWLLLSVNIYCFLGDMIMLAMGIKGCEATWCIKTLPKYTLILAIWGDVQYQGN